MMRSITRIFALACCLPLLAAVPRHVQTADYWGGYSGTKLVPASAAAQALSWVETDNIGAAQIRPLGVKTIMYDNPNRVRPGDAVYSNDERIYAHTCSGSRARGEAAYNGLALTDPRSQLLAGTWRHAIDRHGGLALFSAIFADEADGAAYAADTPCGYSLDNWLNGENTLFHNVGAPVIYNGLNFFDGHNVSKTIALNQNAIGGMMEECYAQLKPDHRVAGWMWNATEQTELRMAHDGKYFFCYGRDLTAADQAYDSRMYTYASFLLTYDPRTSVLWEYYKTPSGGHVMPESRLVAMNPVKKNITSVEQLRTPEGLYMRAYRQCYIAGRSAGACVAIVNPDDDSHALSLPGYRRTLALQGSGVFDGGSAGVQNTAPPASVGPRGALIAFR